MFKIGVLFLVTTVLAKLDKPSYDYILFEVFNGVEPSPEYTKVLPTAKAWVLSLNGDVDKLRLRQATSEEVREVFGATQDVPNHREPRMGNPKQDLSTAAPQTQKTIKVEEKALLNEIMRVINKFALTSNNEPDAYIGHDADKTPTIKLYFKAPQTSLVVRAEGKQWHYIIGPASLFPDWFYVEHSVERDERGPFVDVPKDVTVEFYSALLHLLTMFLTFPV